MNLILVSLLFPIIPNVEVGPNNKVPELQVLSKYLGTWDAEPEGISEIKAVMTVKWILNGNYLEMEDVISHANGTFVKKSKTLMTYDQEKKVYRKWSFNDSGEAVIAEGTWNAKTQTMTLSEKLGKHTIVDKADFSKDGIIQWHSTVSNEDDKLTKEANSLAKRRK